MLEWLYWYRLLGNRLNRATKEKKMIEVASQACVCDAENIEIINIFQITSTLSVSVRLFVISVINCIIWNAVLSDFISQTEVVFLCWEFSAQISRFSATEAHIRRDMVRTNVISITYSLATKVRIWETWINENETRIKMNQGAAEYRAINARKPDISFDGTHVCLVITRTNACLLFFLLLALYFSQFNSHFVNAVRSARFMPHSTNVAEASVNAACWHVDRAYRAVLSSFLIQTY